MVNRLCGLAEKNLWFLLIVVIVAPSPIWVPLVCNTVWRRLKKRRQENRSGSLYYPVFFTLEPA